MKKEMDQRTLLGNMKLAKKRIKGFKGIILTKEILLCSIKMDEDLKLYSKLRMKLQALTHVDEGSVNVKYGFIKMIAGKGVVCAGCKELHKVVFATDEKCLKTSLNIQQK